MKEDIFILTTIINSFIIVIYPWGVYKIGGIMKSINIKINGMT